MLPVFTKCGKHTIIRELANKIIIRKYMMLKTEIEIMNEVKKMGGLKKAYYFLMGAIVGGASMLLFASSTINRLLDVALK